MSAILISLFLLLAIALPLFLVPRIFCLICATIGRNLKSRVSSRRELLFARADAEDTEAQDTQSSSDSEWETVEAQSTPSSGNGEKASSQWDGVIGFFHPFW